MNVMNATTPKIAPRTGMRIQSQQPDGPGGQPPQLPTKLVDKIIDKTYLTANFTASTLSGGVAGLGAYARSAAPATLKATGSLYKNLWKAETIGPNLKIIGSVVAAPLMLAGAAIGLPVSLAVGMYQGGDEVQSSKPRQFTISAATREGYTQTKSGWESLTKSAIESFNDMGSEKLAAGEKPVDIPIIKSVKALAIGVTAAAVGGIAGAVTMVTSAGRQIGAGVVDSLTDSSLGLGGKLLGTAGAVLGGAVHGVSYGLGTFASVTGQGFGETWKKDSVVQGGSRVLSQAWNSVAASVAPEGTLLKEKPDFK
ncbi:hypothetical protein ABS71_00130 [bacterium SCN 62-11]|nr:hypothetical protein [Candidatus Eremiobacteraeota bacterium]ODT82566.1 MAG: hypothetical protein ABS71_00130 [bacterium SCN 62-11]